MSSLIPISTYNLALEPFKPQPALDDEFPVTIRLTMAAVDPEAVDDKEEPSTVRILKKSRAFLDDDEDDLLDIEAEEDDELDEEEGEDEKIVEMKSSKDKAEKKGKKAGKKDKKDEDENKKDEEDDDDEEDEEDDDDEEDDEDSDLDDDDEIEEFVLCTLSPKVQFQQTLDLTISPDEEVYFVATGSYPVHLTGNYVEHPADEEDSEDDDESYSDEDDEDAYNLTPDEDELVNKLEDVSDVEGIIEELVEKEANTKKRAAEVSSESKKNKKAKEEKKKVQFTEKLVQGPTPSKKEKKKAEKADRADKDESGKTEDKKDKKFSTKTLSGGVVIEDRKVGSGASAKSGNKVGIRYIGKLKTGKVFDKNTSGKPFVFKLGMGECIKGFDLGVAGMTVGGERRVIIPAKMGYGSQSLPGIPANSELTFDIKLVSLK